MLVLQVLQPNRRQIEDPGHEELHVSWEAPAGDEELSTDVNRCETPVKRRHGKQGPWTSTYHRIQGDPHSKPRRWAVASLPAWACGKEPVSCSNGRSCRSSSDHVLECVSVDGPLRTPWTDPEGPPNKKSPVLSIKFAGPVYRYGLTSSDSLLMVPLGFGSHIDARPSVGRRSKKG